MGRRGAVGPGPSALIGSSSCHAPRGNVAAVSDQPAILARGPWQVEEVEAVWRDEHFEPSAERAEAADRAITALRERGSPSHDGLAARLVGHRVDEGRLVLELQPVRWALRLVEGDASCSVAALCVTRDAQGRWLAGRRAPWLSSWPGQWALGAGGAVDVGENPGDTLVRELAEEWAVAPARVQGEALVRLPQHLIMFVGQAWLPEGAEDEVAPDHEHDASPSTRRSAQRTGCRSSSRRPSASSWWTRRAASPSWLGEPRSRRAAIAASAASPRSGGGA